MFIKQLFETESSTYTYLIFDHLHGEAVLIDPVIETYERDESLIKELGLDLRFVIETHIHADHATSSGEFRRDFGAKVIASKGGGQGGVDKYLDHNEELVLKNFTLKGIYTPGHTNSCMCFYLNHSKVSAVFTGDTVLIRGCGRTDFQEGSNETLWNSVKNNIFTLPDETIIYPGHDYKGRMSSSVLEEKNLNPRLGGNVSYEEFCHIMDNLNLSYPKKIDKVLPLNKKIS